jgi:WD40 repeat protein
MLYLDGWGGFNSGVKYSSDGGILLAVCCNEKILTLDVKTEITQALITVPAPIQSVDLSPDGQIVGVISDHQAFLYDASTGAQLYPFPQAINGQATTYAQALAFSADGRRIAAGARVGTKTKILVFSLPDRQNVLALEFPGAGLVTAIAFSPDSSLILGAGAVGKNELLLWDARTGKRLQEFSGYSGALWAVAFSPDGRFVAAGGDDASIHMWELATGQEVRRFQGHAASIHAIQFSPDGAWLATASQDGTLKLWHTELQALKDALCSVLQRDLSAEERARYGITDAAPTCPRFNQP